MQKVFPKQKFVKCPECSAEILVLPDVPAMAKAIKNHIKLHRKLRAFKKVKIVNNLTQQVLLVIASVDAAKLPDRVWLLVESYFGVKHVLGVALSEADAEAWVSAKCGENPEGSYFYETSTVVASEASR